MITSRERRGFTLIELLLVISIIGVLLSLLLPAINAARESARKTQCKNNVRQIAIAFAAHDATQGHLPTGGWGFGWQGDPERGFGEKQPGGWVYNILPFIEQGRLRQASTDIDPQRKMAIEIAAIPIPMMHCIARRAAVPYPYTARGSGFYNMERPTVLARTDYAACSGNTPIYSFGRGAPSLEAGDTTYNWRPDNFTGICYRRSEVTFSMIPAGSSNTYMVGEGYLDPNHYTDGDAENDDQGMYVGFDFDTIRSTSSDFPPMRDTAGVANEIGFGSTHPNGFIMSFCDGSVREIAYAVDPFLHRRQGDRTSAAASSE